MAECCGGCSRVLAELAVIRRLLEDRPSLSRCDRQALSRLLPAIGGAVGDDLFLASEIASHRSPAVRVGRGTLTTRQIGRLLKRAEGIEVDGYVVSREGAEGGAVLWRVRAVPEFLKD